MLKLFITRENDFRSAWTAGHSHFWQSGRSFCCVIQLCQNWALYPDSQSVRPVMQSSLRKSDLYRKVTEHERMYAAAVPNGRVRRSLTRQEVSLSMRR